jgi:ubiquinone/menaquinone biosynthesis C-methylase UbiE
MSRVRAPSDALPKEGPGGGVCPAEHAGWLSTPLRRLVTDPQRILRGLAEPGDTVVDLGCGPGFFTLPLAEMVGEGGSVIAVDLQAEMLDMVLARAARKGLATRIRLHRCAVDSLGLEGERADFALAFWMVHEVPDAARFFADVHAMLKDGARLLLVEPRGHVGKQAFARTLELAAAAELALQARPHVAFSRAALLVRS